MISIIVPIYNSSKYLRECLDSIIKQTYENYELLLINDGSTDDSLNICQSYGDSRIKIFDLEHKGVSFARNYGLKVANGDYVCFIDSDDVVDEEYLNKLISNMEKGIDFVECDFLYLNKQRKDSNDNFIYCTKKDMFFRLYSENGIRTGIIVNKLFRKELFDDLCFENKCNEDEFIIHKVFSKIRKVKVLNNILYFYRIHDNSRQRIISEDRIQSLTVFAERKKYFRDRKFLILNDLSYFNSMIYLYCVFYKYMQYDNMKKISVMFHKEFHFNIHFGLKNNLKFLLFLIIPRLLGKLMLYSRRYDYA